MSNVMLAITRNYINDIENSTEKIIDLLGIDKMRDILRKAQNFIHHNEDTLERWTSALIASKLNKNEYEFLVKGLKDCFEMTDLVMFGISFRVINTLRSLLVNMYIMSALQVVRVV